MHILNIWLCVNWKEFVSGTNVCELLVKAKRSVLNECQAVRGICLRKESKAHWEIIQARPSISQRAQFSITLSAVMGS